MASRPFPFGAARQDLSETTLTGDSVTTISAILLAAGQSRRMAPVNKLALDVQGVPLVLRTARTLLSCPLEEVVVVVGHEAERVRAMLDGLPVCVVYNEHYNQGRVTSIQAGLAALAKPCDGFMVCLSDQALLEPTDVSELISAFAQRSHGSVLVPQYQGRRGNPVICDGQHRRALLNGDSRLSCRQFIDQHPELVYPFPVDRDHVLFDVDTPADYERLIGRLGQRDARMDAEAAACRAGGAML